MKMIKGFWYLRSNESLLLTLIIIFIDCKLGQEKMHNTIKIFFFSAEDRLLLTMFFRAPMITFLTFQTNIVLNHEDKHKT